MHPQLAEGYRRRIDRLELLLEGSRTGRGARGRALNDRPRVPEAEAGRALDATLFGALATLLSVSAEVSGNKKPSAAGPTEGQLSVVAGARNRLDLLLVT